MISVKSKSKRRTNKKTIDTKIIWRLFYSFIFLCQRNPFHKYLRNNNSYFQYTKIGLLYYIIFAIFQRFIVNNILLHEYCFRYNKISNYFDLELRKFHLLQHWSCKVPVSLTYTSELHRRLLANFVDESKLCTY